MGKTLEGIKALSKSFYYKNIVIKFILTVKRFLPFSFIQIFQAA